MEQCPYCNKEYKKNGIASHIWRKHTEEGRKFLPTKDKKIFPNSRQFKEETKQKISKSLKGRPPWNKGLTKNDDIRLKKHSNSMKKAHKEGRANNWTDSGSLLQPSYPEIFFEQVIQNKFEDKNYNKEFKIGKYRIDFAWPYKKLAIEIDGRQHDFEDRKEKDIQKDNFLKNNGWQILRIKCIDLFNNTNIWIQLANDFINNSINYKEYYEVIYNSYINEIDYNLLMDLLGIEFKLDKIGRKKLFDKKDINNKINLLLNSNIDFSKFGWVQKVSEILKISPQKVSKWMKNNMLEFYNTKCFKRK